MVESQCQHDRTWDILRGNPRMYAQRGADGYISHVALTRRLRFVPDRWEKGFSKQVQPVCYFDSGYRQKKLYDKPQYGYIIFWGGGPIIWKSKRHSQIPQSVSQAEFETITHAWRDIKWVRELIKELGLGKWVERPTPMIGDNQNSIVVR